MNTQAETTDPTITYPITVAQIATMGVIFSHIREVSEPSDYIMTWEEETTYDSILFGFYEIIDSEAYSTEIVAAVMNNI